MIQCLQDLNDKLKTKKSKLHLYYGTQEKIIEKMIQKDNSIEGVFFNKDYTKYAIEREQKIKKTCNKFDIEIFVYQDYLLQPVDSVKTNDGNFYSKFTPYYNKIKLIKVKKPDTKTLKNFVKKYKNIKETTFKKIMEKYLDEPDISTEHNIFTGSRNDGIAIKNNLKNFKDYDETRNILLLPTTRMSAHIKFGTISIREVYHKLLENYGRNDPIIRQLYWREFYFTIAYNRPDIFKGKSFKEKYDKIKWKKSKKLFQLWKDGNTGYPSIDASMRELNATGYMHNRGRLLTSNFLVKLLNLDWKDGEKYFAQKLIDYDPAVNNGNWQWTAGSGADSQQYNRIYNPYTQGERHDPEAEYIKLWIPELNDINPKHIHNWNTYYKEYKHIDYPKPVLDYQKLREKSLALYKKGLYS